MTDDLRDGIGEPAPQDGAKATWETPRLVRQAVGSSTEGGIVFRRIESGAVYYPS